MLVILEITIALISIKKLLYQCNPPYTKRASSHRVLYLEVLSTYNICIIYLHVIQACVNVTVSMFYFSNLKNASDVMKNIFNSISIYSRKKNFLVNKHKKQKCYKENKSLFSKSFSFPFSVKCFDRNFKCFLSCTLPFLNALKFEDSKHIKIYIFYYFPWK